ncbi:hypothetical protein BHE74_00018120 [Ensete ventricosum]|nr:hypothetical protein BHE74_00018120 [Ensete ventricosum]RZR80437.1 hypothetical protein BHM03_00006485 [Ensete ventricosum]
MVKPSRRVRLSLLLSCFLATLPDDARDPTQLVYVGSVLARPLRCLSHRDREEGTIGGFREANLCGRTRKVKLTEVRGIANSKNFVLMQGLVCGLWSVRGHPKVIETWRHRALKLSLHKEWIRVTREWVGKSELPKERMQSEMAGAI